MSNPCIGEIRMFAGTFAPAGWAFCHGQEMRIEENEALFQLLLTRYGGDGEQTFNLPDLRGRVPVHAGRAQGSSVDYTLAEVGGIETVTLSTQHLPYHNHQLLASQNAGASANAANNVLSADPDNQMYTQDTPAASTAISNVSSVGGFLPHSNMQPYVVVHYIISLFGVYPSPS